MNLRDADEDEDELAVAKHEAAATGRGTAPARADYRLHRAYCQRAMTRWHRAVAAGLDFPQWAASSFT